MIRLKHKCGHEVASMSLSFTFLPIIFGSLLYLWHQRIGSFLLYQIINSSIIASMIVIGEGAIFLALIVNVVSRFVVAGTINKAIILDYLVKGYEKQGDWNEDEKAKLELK